MTIDRVRDSVPFVLPEGLPLLREVRSAHDLAQALFIDALTRRGLGHVREIAVRIPPDSAATLVSGSVSLLIALRDDFGEASVFELDPGAVQAWLSASSGHAMVAAASPADADGLAERARSRNTGGISSARRLHMPVLSDDRRERVYIRATQ
jgi:hypothetical protein